jgi:hypothetical protein
LLDVAQGHQEVENKLRVLEETREREEEGQLQFINGWYHRSRIRWPKLSVNATEEAGGGGRAKQPIGHKATKTNMHHQASSLAFQETLRELMAKKKEAITEREER